MNNNSNNSNKYLHEIKSIVEKEIEKTSLLRELSLLLQDDPLMPNVNNPNSVLYKPNQDIINTIKEIISSKQNNNSNNSLNKPEVTLRLNQLKKHGIDLMQTTSSSNLTTGGRKKRASKKRIIKK